jgi:hypothetical protein
VTKPSVARELLTQTPLTRAARRPRTPSTQPRCTAVTLPCVQSLRRAASAPRIPRCLPRVST